MLKPRRFAFTATANTVGKLYIENKHTVDLEEFMVILTIQYWFESIHWTFLSEDYR